jgi:hypothetical protein
MQNPSLLASWAQIISLPVAIIAVLVSVWLYLRGRQRRALGCGFFPISSPILIGAGETVKSDIEIRYKGRDVQELFIVQAELKNTGNVPIRKSHIVEPVTFTFDPGAELLDMPRVTYKIPSDLKVSWDFSQTPPDAKPNVVGLDFDLLNPGDRFGVEFVWIGPPTEPKVSTRIEGVGKVEPLGREELQRWVDWASLVALELVLVGIGAFLVYMLVNPSDFVLGAAAGFGFAGIISLVLTQIRDLRVRMSRRTAHPNQAKDIQD